MATVAVKCYLEKPDLSVETRRFVVEQATIGSEGIHQLVNVKVGKAFPDLKGKRFSLFWKDEDNDFVTVSTNDEIRDFLSRGENGVCKMYIKVCGDAEEGTEKSGRDESAETMEKGSHDEPNPCDDTTPDHQPLHGGPFTDHPHPPPFLGFHSHGPFGGPFGGSWGCKNGRGHHPHHHRGMHHHHHHGAGWHRHHGRHWGPKGHKDALRAMVPVPHRRWAKSYIQSWRSENLKNATTTTTDSDGNVDWKISMVEANVPQAYAEWLDINLLHWHKRWSDDEMGSENETDNRAKIALKESVPKEFRRWTKWYLNTHCGRRDAPKFQRHQNGCGANKDFCDKDKLCEAVAREHRIATKNFIQNWRIEKKLDNPKSLGDGEDCVAEVNDSERFSLPEAYKQWLETFLLRWHVWRGWLEKTPGISMQGNMGQFKDSVPMEYRAWVKYFMVVHYNKHNKKSKQCSEVEVDPSQRKYDVMLQAFQKKWMKKQRGQAVDSDNLVYMSSSEEEKEEEADKGEPESSFERLSISKENGCKKSKVKCDDQAGTAKKQKTSKKTGEDFPMSDSDGLDDDVDDEEVAQKKERMNPSFRQWMKQKLFEWDGQAVDKESSAQQDAEEDVQLPSNVYDWMSETMAKMQMKKMKKQLKATKQELKASKKKQKEEAR